jgi:hypothetical protein
VIDELAASIRANGFAVWPCFLDAQRCGELRKAAAGLLATGPARPYPKSTRVWDLYLHGPVFVDVLRHAGLIRLLDLVVGAHHLLSDHSLNVVHPGQPGDHWHLDYPYNEMDTLVSGSTLGVQCVLALDEFRRDNGATEIIAGTHREPRRPGAADRSRRPTTTFLGAPGTLLVLAATTWHRSGVNASRLPRTAMLLSFVERWVRPLSDPPAELPFAPDTHLDILLGRRRPPETINGVSV